MQFDFLTLDCVSGENSYYNKLYVTQFVPLLLFVVIALVGVLRAIVVNCRAKTGREKAHQVIFNQHMYASLLLSYCVLPTVAALQFKSLQCTTLEHDGEVVGSFLKEDSSISCLSPSYKRFRAIVIVGIFVYEPIPLLWFVLLWRVRHELNPPGQSEKSALLLRDKSPRLEPYKFLFSDYRPSRWAYEVYEMLRRLFFVGVLPLLGEGAVRAFIGIFLSIWTVLIARESWPFNRSTTCVLLVVATLQILFVYFCASLILTGSLEGFGLSNLLLGVILLATNVLSFLLVIFWGFEIKREERQLKKKREGKVKKIEQATTFSEKSS